MLNFSYIFISSFILHLFIIVGNYSLGLDIEILQN
jgi:hypothetical protein